MEKALLAAQVLFYLMGGMGLFFLGIGVLWFVDVYKKKDAQYRNIAGWLRLDEVMVDPGGQPNKSFQLTKPPVRGVTGGFAAEANVKLNGQINTRSPQCLQHIKLANI